MRHLIKMLTLALPFLAGILTVTAQPPVASGLTLTERLGYAWDNELVHLPLTAVELAAARAGQALLAADGTEVSYQVVPGATAEAPTRLALLVSLKPYEQQNWQFTTRPAKPVSDLELSEEGDLWRVSNAVIGVALRKTLAKGQGPLASIRLRDGAWIGESRLADAGELAESATVAVARGPVFAELLTTVRYQDGGTWSLRWRLVAGEPAITIAEEFLAANGGTWQVQLTDAKFKPSHLLFRAGMLPNLGKVMAAGLGAQGPVFTLQPWLHWWANERQGNWLALYRSLPPKLEAKGELKVKDDSGLEEIHLEAPPPPPDPHPEMLSVGVLRPSLWVTPGWKNAIPQAPAVVPVSLVAGQVTLSLQVRGGQRLWLLGTPAKAASLSVLDLPDPSFSPPPQKLVIKYGDFPLDRVKDMVLDWPTAHEATHPRLFVKAADLPAMRAATKIDPAETRRWLEGPPYSRYQLDGPVREFLLGEDPKLGARLASTANDWLRESVHSYLVQDGRLPMIGVAPHMQTQVNSAVNAIDAVLDSKHYTPVQRQQARARLAFLGYVVNSPDYWSAERGFRANPNMTTTVATYQTIIACMLPTHPMAKTWATAALAELRDRQLHGWSDADGGWLEAPHYAIVSLDHILGSLLAARNNGFGDFVNDDRLRQVARWVAIISTPRDSRTKGWRHLPPIGNTYHGEPTGIYALLGSIWAEPDPVFAGHMQWFFEEHGSWPEAGIGGFSPTLVGYRLLLKRPAVTAQKPDWGSTLFRQTGVVLRNTLGHERESYLHLIAGRNHDHYDHDSGSIMLYGLGRVLADDWGYIGRHPEYYHSLLSSKAIGGGNMQIEAFAPAAPLDYVSGQKGAWKRQIAFSKDADPSGPTAFLVRDSHSATDPATWRLWLSTRLEPKAADADMPNTNPDKALGGAGAEPGLELDDPATVKAKAPSAAELAKRPVRLQPWGATSVGAEDVDLEIYLYQADTLALRTETAEQPQTCANRFGQVGAMTFTQTALTATLAGKGAITALLYPRLKTAPPPKVTWLADGRAVRIETASGTDTLFLSEAPMEFAEGDLKFSGQAGASQQRAKSVTLTLGAGGSLRLGPHELVGEAPVTRQFGP